MPIPYDAIFGGGSPIYQLFGGSPPPSTHLCCAGEASGLMLLDAFRSLWKIDQQQPVVPSHPEVLSSRPGIIVACKVGVREGGQWSGHPKSMRIYVTWPGPSHPFMRARPVVPEIGAGAPNKPFPCSSWVHPGFPSVSTPGFWHQHGRLRGPADGPVAGASVHRLAA